jgi:hypothetical protein
MNLSKSSVSDWLKKNIVIIFSVPLLGWQLINGWFYFGTRDDFMDFKYILERADCLPEAMSKLYSERNMADACTGYIYGSILLRILNFLSIGQLQLVSIGYILFAVVSFFYFKSTRGIHSVFQAIVYLALFYSPPIVLLFERANLDSLIFILVTIYAVLLVHKNYLGSFFIVALASLFKFYTTPLLFATAFVTKKVLRLSLLVISILVSVQVYIDVESVKELPWDARNMFGNIIWGEYLLYLLRGTDTHANFFVSTLLGFGLLGTVLWILKKYIKNISHWTYNGSKEHKFFIIYFFIYLTCYFTGLSVDYRLIYLLFSFIYFEKTLKLQRRVTFLTRTCMLFTFYFSFNSGNLQPIGDLAQVVFIAILILVLGPSVKLRSLRMVDKVQVITAMVFNRTSRN